MEVKKDGPIIKKSKTGKLYFIVNGHNIFIKAKMTKKEIKLIYNFLKKHLPHKKTTSKTETKKELAKVIKTAPKGLFGRRGRFGRRPGSFYSKFQPIVPLAPLGKDDVKDILKNVLKKENEIPKSGPGAMVLYQGPPGRPVPIDFSRPTMQERLTALKNDVRLGELERELDPVKKQQLANILGLAYGLPIPNFFPRQPQPQQRQYATPRQQSRPQAQPQPPTLEQNLYDPNKQDLVEIVSPMEQIRRQPIKTNLSETEFEEANALSQSLLGKPYTPMEFDPTLAKGFESAEEVRNYYINELGLTPEQYEKELLEPENEGLFEYQTKEEQEQAQQEQAQEQAIRQAQHEANLNKYRHELENINIANELGITDARARNMPEEHIREIEKETRQEKRDLARRYNILPEDVQEQNRQEQITREHNLRLKEQQERELKQKQLEDELHLARQQEASREPSMEQVGLPNDIANLFTQAEFPVSEPERTQPIESLPASAAMEQLPEKFDVRTAEYNVVAKLARKLRKKYPKFGLPEPTKYDGKEQRFRLLDFKPFLDKIRLIPGGPQAINELYAEIKAKAGKGKGGGKDDALYNDQIDKIMDKYKDFKGCIMRDEIPKLIPYVKEQSRIGFIINTDKANKPGTHWQAILIDARPEGSNSLEFFDSFGRSIPPDVLEDCKGLLKALKPVTVLKVKENRVVHQSDNTQNCGWFCIQFLIDRIARNKTFAEATGYNDKLKIDHIKKDEKEIEKMKNLPKFKYI